mmetsp:Transcript_41954/g.132269  ORF Transcript_41954/g.132269 Transcript_41954/m.132269 type:complete len:472 (-) Transcript_41954:1026-2441(-)
MAEAVFPTCRLLFLALIVQLASSMDTPLDGVPLPRSVTQMESKLGVSDNMLPGGKRSVDKGQFALSSYDQEILAKGPPQQGSGPPPDQPTQPAAPSPSYSPMGSYSQGSYQSPYAAYPNTYGSGTAASTQSPGYSYYQPQQYSPYQASPYQASYQSQPVYQQQYSQYPQQSAYPTGSSYYDYSQVHGRLGGANSMIASAAAYTDPTQGSQSSQGRQYSKFGWHPTLERIMGVPKNQRTTGPRLALHGQLSKMESMAKPNLKPESPSVDPTQSNVAAEKLKKAQELLRKSVSLGLQIGTNKKDEDKQLKKDPCTTLRCERTLTHGGRTDGVLVNQNRQGRQISSQEALAHTTKKHMASMHAALKANLRAQDSDSQSNYGDSVHAAAIKSRARKAINYKAWQLHEGSSLPGTEGAEAGSGTADVKKVGPESSIVMAVLMLIFIGVVGMAGVVAWVHARREKKRHALQALKGFA